MGIPVPWQPALDDPRSTAHSEAAEQSRSGPSRVDVGQRIRGTHLPVSCPEEKWCWAAYSGASPDPAASPSAPHGVVWGAREWNAASPNPSGGPGWADMDLHRVAMTKQHQSRHGRGWAPRRRCEDV